MNSRFVYPTNTGSLGQHRRLSTPVDLINRGASSPAMRAMEDCPPASTTATRAKPTVLVVEDDDDSLFALKSILRLKGYRVIEAWDGKQAVQVAETHAVDLILLDLVLPRLHGLGVVRRLRESPKHEALPIVIMTGQPPEENRDSAILAGCDDFLLKPIDFDRLDMLLDYYAPLAASSDS